MLPPFMLAISVPFARKSSARTKERHCNIEWGKYVPENTDMMVRTYIRRDLEDVDSLYARDMDDELYAYVIRGL